MSSGSEFLRRIEEQEVFKLDAKHMTLPKRRILKDAAGEPICEIRAKKFSMHGKWIVSKPGNDDDVIFTFEPHLLAITPKVDIYLKDGDREVDFYAKGNFREKHFQFYDKRGGGDGVKIGECKKQSMFKSLEAFAGRDVYFLDVEPGVDYAFLVTICVLMDEKFHDKE